MANIFAKTFGRGAASKGGSSRAPSAPVTRGTIKLEGRRFDREGKEVPEEEGGRRISNQQILSGSFTSVSAFGDITEGFQKKAALTREARQLDLAARSESLRGAASAINESIRTTAALGSQFVSGGGSLFTGSSAGAITAEFEDLQTNINITRFSAEQRAALIRDAATRAKQQAKFAIIGGFFKASERAAVAVSGFFGGAGTR